MIRLADPHRIMWVDARKIAENGVEYLVPWSKPVMQSRKGNPFTCSPGQKSGSGYSEVVTCVELLYTSSNTHHQIRKIISKN
jgi:hypothetical protein